MMISDKQQVRFFYFNLVAVIMAFGAYTLPWLTNPGVALSPGALDLAEWASLHPEVRAMSPSMLTPLLLRTPVVMLTLLLAFSTPAKMRPLSRERIIGTLVIGILLLITFPPWEIYSARNDPNYQQQAQLIAIAVIGSAIGLVGVFSPWRSFIVIIAALIGIAASTWGLQQAYALMVDFELPVHVGFGGIGFSLILLVVIITTGWVKNIKQD